MLPSWLTALGPWGTAILTGTGVALIAGLLLPLLAKRLRAAAARTHTPWDDDAADALATRSRLAPVALAAFAAAQVVNLPAPTAQGLLTIAAIAAIGQAALWTDHLGSAYVLRRQRAAETSGRAGDIPIWTVFGIAGRTVVWIIAGMWALGELGVDVSTLVAGLGVGGIAVGLALQSILGDVFASLSIVFDKPFAIGDDLEIDGFAGRVEHIGLRSTRLRSVNGEQIVLSNADLLKGRIRNFQPLTERRVKLTLGVTYDTPTEKLAAIPVFAREVIAAVPLSRFDRAHIVRLAESSIDVEVVFTFQSADAIAHLDAQQAVILGLLRKLEAEGVQLAFPTRTLHLNPTGSPHA